MKLEDRILKPDSRSYMERYVNKNTRTYSTLSNYSEAEPAYSPQNTRRDFEVQSRIIPMEKVETWGEQGTNDLLSMYIRGKDVLFPIHPQIWNDTSVAHMEELHTFPISSEILTVQPTASTRTLEVENRTPSHYLKLHYPKKISRYTRKLRRSTVKFCVELTRDFKEFDFSTSLAFLPESAGIAFGGQESGWGCILREQKPFPYVTSPRFLIPYFALYGEDVNAPGDKPLLVQLVERSNIDPKEFILEKIIFPPIELWCRAVRERGMLLEPHGQNLLLEIDESYMPTRSVIRDLDIVIDAQMRTAKGLDSTIFFTNDGFQKNVLGSNPKIPFERNKLYSLMYDSMLGHHLLEYIASIAATYFSVDPSELREEGKKHFHTFFPDADIYFDTKSYYYPSDGGDLSALVETDMQPAWR